MKSPDFDGSFYLRPPSKWMVGNSPIFNFVGCGGKNEKDFDRGFGVVFLDGDFRFGFGSNHAVAGRRSSDRHFENQQEH